MKTLLTFTILLAAAVPVPGQDVQPERPARPPGSGGGDGRLQPEFPAPGGGDRPPQARPGPGPEGRQPRGPGMNPGGGPGGQQDGPWNRNLHQMIVTADGKVESSGFFVQSAGVPSIVQDGNGRLVVAFQWFPQGERDLFDQVALTVSSDGGKAWTTPRKMSVSGLPEGMRRPYDPTLTIPGDGQLRVYFTSHESRNPDSSAIYSALSTDGGATFLFEPGRRFGIDRPIMDCAVAKLGDTWHLICPQHSGGAVHAVSADGLTFTRTDDIKPVKGFSWIGNLTAEAGRLRFWMGAAEGMLMLESTDGIEWSAAKPLGLKGVDPAALSLADGRTLVLFTGPSFMAGPGPGPGGFPGSAPGEPGRRLVPESREPRGPEVKLKRETPAEGKN